MTPMTRDEWELEFGQYLSPERAPNGDFQLRPDAIGEILDRQIVARRGVRALANPGDAFFGQTRMEVLAEFLEDARRELELIEGKDPEIERYR